MCGFRSISGWEGGESTPQNMLCENKILDLPRSWHLLHRKFPPPRMRPLLTEAPQFVECGNRACGTVEHRFPYARIHRRMRFDCRDAACPVCGGQSQQWTKRRKQMRQWTLLQKGAVSTVAAALVSAVAWVQIFQSVNRANLPLSRCCVAAGFGIRTPAAPVRGRFAAMLHRSGLTSTRHGM